MTTSPIVNITDELIAELEAAAKAFPEYEWDSNYTEFFNGPSGESLGGEPTGFYCVYGSDFEIDGEPYDGPVLVEACPLDQAKFICEAKTTILALLAHVAELKKDAAIMRRALERLAQAPGCGCSFPCRCGGAEWTQAELEGRIDLAIGALKAMQEPKP